MIKANTHSNTHSHSTPLSIPQAPFVQAAPSQAKTQDTGQNGGLYNMFHSNFDLLVANTPNLMQQAYRIRYHAYCLEKCFESQEENPDGVETDDYDAHSVHALLRHKRSGLFLGTMRMIFRTPDNVLLPIQKARHGADHFLREEHIPGSFVEISRFCISQERRKKTGDDSLVLNLGMTGLVLSTFWLSEKFKVSHWIGAMEPFLFGRLARLGVTMDHVGDPFEYHGKRQSFMTDIQSTLGRIAQTHPHVWMLMSNSGVLNLKENPGAM
jgi:N-acyl-L-homoserine lactone synthetase